jgi:hypothetical protein
MTKKKEVYKTGIDEESDMYYILGPGVEYWDKSEKIRDEVASMIRRAYDAGIKKGIAIGRRQ